MGHRARTGWGLFLLSAALFTWAGVRAGDVAVTAGSIVFGLACILFLLPERSDSPAAGGDRAREQAQQDPAPETTED
jgi:hypothetical protein